uniref:Transthyretin-like family protein n=1 Tax=Heterorhabditis bacteriophora TaxID=37862 RepID=A0A1I7XAX9_HETBA
MFTQSAGVKGILMCGDRPLANAKIKLYDDDSVHNHNIYIYIYVYPCQRKVSFNIPKSFVSSGQQPKMFFNIGQINMQIEFQSEERDCVHRL